jgi:DNA-binding SARP family transcriptional activator
VIVKVDAIGWEPVVTRPVLICLLGSFRVIKAGAEVQMRANGKTAALLSSLALGSRYRVSRQLLLRTLWPDSEETRAAHALQSMVHALRESLGDALAGAAPVVYAAGAYELNTDAGIGVDIAYFDTLARTTEQHLRAGDTAAAVRSSRCAFDIYRGDLCVIDDMRAILERERLRTLYLTLLSRLADAYFSQHDYRVALDYTRRLLTHDPCREDAHRLVMRCHVRLGERAQALRQYRTCSQILVAEFDARPEQLTEALYERVRLDPDSV